MDLNVTIKFSLFSLPQSLEQWEANGDSVYYK